MKRITHLGILIAIAFILNYIEHILPLTFLVPGIKLGLANIVTLIVLYEFGTLEAYFTVLVRTVFAGFLYGGLFSILYSLAGGILSLFIMFLLKKTKKFSVIGVSIAGGVFHNIGQLIIAIFVLENFRIAYYFSILMIAGIFSGFIIGLLSGLIIKRLFQCKEGVEL